MGDNRGSRSAPWQPLEMVDNRRNILVLFFTLAVVMMGYSMVMPIIPFYIEKLGASGKEMGLLVASAALMQFIFAPLWGSLSDRVGRKPVLLVGISGYAVTMFLFGISTELWMLFAARCLYGILSSAALPTAMAYIADNTTAQNRSRSMGSLGAAVGLGVVIGPGISGWMAAFELSAPFFLGTGLALLAFGMVLMLLPETHPPGHVGLPVQPGISNRWILMVSSVRGPFGSLMALTFIVSFGMSNFQGIMGLYVLDKLGLDTRQIGILWTLVGGLLIIGQGALTSLLTNWLGDAAAIRLSLLLTSLGFALIIFTETFLVFLAAAGFLILSISILGPVLNARVSIVAGDNQGIIMGINNSMMSLGKVIGPIWAGYIYDLNWDFPFVSGAVILMAGFMISFATIHPNKDRTDQKKAAGME